MAAAAAAAATTTPASATTAGASNNNNVAPTVVASHVAASKVADSTDACSSERYSPSSSSNAKDEFEPAHGSYDHYDNDCDMPTDLSMESCERRNLTASYLPTIKSEKVAS